MSDARLLDEHEARDPHDGDHDRDALLEQHPVSHLGIRGGGRVGVRVRVRRVRSTPLRTLTPCCAARRRIIRPPSEPMHDVLAPD